MTDDEHRFTEIYDACRQRVWAYAVSRAGRQIADEVVSETFAIVWRRLGEVPEPAAAVAARRGPQRIAIRPIRQWRKAR